MLAEPDRLERLAVRLLKPVGGRHEWWWWNSTLRVGHLRVPLTDAEFARVPTGVPEMDAGETGSRRRRSKR
jgi:hypothetical protein